MQVKRLSALLLSSLWYFMPNVGIKNALHLFIKNGGFKNLLLSSLWYIMPNLGIKNTLHLFRKYSGFKNLTQLPVCY